MITPHPLMSDQLYKDVVEFHCDPMSCLSKDALMVQYWDEVSLNVLRVADLLGIPPRVVIEEFCVNSDFPDYIPMTPGKAYD